MTTVDECTSASARLLSFRESRAQLHDVVDRLLAEYGELLSAGSIVRCVARTAESCTRAPGDQHRMPARVEHLSRLRIEARLRDGWWPPLSSLPAARGLT